MIVCVIPARGGSKRIPKKNVREFCGRPLIARAVSTASNSGLFEEILVSTDDEATANIARAEGALVPFKRPRELSDDFTGTNAVVAHATRWMRRAHRPATLVCCLYATTPLLLPADLEAGRAALEAHPGAEFSFAAAEFAAPVHRSLIVDDSGFAQPIFQDMIGSRSQDLPQALHDAGAFYWGRPESFELHEIVFLAHAVPVVLPRLRVQDIDTPSDWANAEALFALLSSSP